jgi:hypothetical protein
MFDAQHHEDKGTDEFFLRATEANKLQFCRVATRTCETIGDTAAKISGTALRFCGNLYSDNQNVITRNDPGV